MKIYVDESPMGAGKTKRAVDTITNNPCKTVFITERIKSFDELELRMREAASRHGTNPQIKRINGDCLNWCSSVSREIERVPEFFRSHDHVTVLATHAAMLRSDFSGFSGWQIIVDEVPQFLDFEQRCTPLDAAFFQQYYQLEPDHDGWNAVSLTDAGQALTVAKVRADDSHSHLAVFHARVIESCRPDAARRVLCNLPDWKAMKADKVQWCWASAFSLWELQAFDRVELLGNRFRRDIGSILSEKLNTQPLEWIALPPLPTRAFVHRQVHIHYFSESRSSSRHLFESPQGQALLGDIGTQLAQALPEGQFIWSANATVAKDKYLSSQELLERAGLPAGSYLSPRQAGTNQFKAKTHAAMIYSAKASPNLRALLKGLKIPVVSWERSVEHEAILQFATRTSVRDPDNASPVHLWVFDRQQAQYLKEYFDTIPHVTAHLEPVTDGPVIPKTKTRGPKAAVRTLEEDEVYKAEKLRKDAERKRRERAADKAVEAALLLKAA